jgi:hypothetical protein
MENILNPEELNTLETIILLLVYTVISLAAYLVSTKGMYDLFPSIFKALGAFLIELAVSAVLSLAVYGIFRSTAVNLPTELNSLILLTFALVIIITVFARKITLTYATDIQTSVLQAVTSLVMHFFYILVISFFITFLYALIFPGSIDPSIFGK